MGNCVTIATNPLMPAVDFAKALTLVVGNDTECKALVAEGLAEASGARTFDVTKAGVRIFTRESDPGSVPVVIDTVPLSTSEDWKPVEAARAWISKNGLRKLGGTLVFVVCVIASTDPEDEIYQKPDFGGNRFSWLHLLACAFEQHTQKIMLLVHSEDKSVEISEDSSTNVSSRGLPQLREALKRDGFTGKDNIIFFNCRGERVRPTMKLVRQYSAYRDDDEDDDDDQPKAEAGPFLLPWVPRNAAKKDRFGAWGPENIILFGRSGSGKSTLAQMLTSGRLDSRRRTLTVSASLRGETTKVSTAFGRGWCVIDTPGLGESDDDDKSSIATAKARELIKNHVQLVEGTYSHFFYVWKKARVEQLDELLWKEFKRAFEAEEIKTPMTVVVSDADQEWLEREENISRLKQCFEGCESFVTAYFPLPEKDDDYDADKESTDLRLESLKELEDEISSLSRKDTSTKVGKWSRGTQLREWKRREYDYTTLRPSIRQSPAFGPSAADPQPSDYDAARLYIRMQSWKSKIAAIIWQLWK